MTKGQAFIKRLYKMNRHDKINYDSSTKQHELSDNVSLILPAAYTCDITFTPLSCMPTLSQRALL